MQDILTPEFRETLVPRIKKTIEEAARFNSTPGDGITRFPFTKEAVQVCDYLEQVMKDAGLETGRDASGAVIGRIEGEVPRTILLESHYDTVLHGGAYDGMAGVVCGIEIARIIKESGKKPYYSLEVMATNDEEGSRFSSGFFTSMVVCGKVTPEYCRSDRDKDGVSIAEAMEAAGLDPDKLPQEPRKDIAAVFEIHCEQGPVLEQKGIDLGIVEAITGTHRVQIDLIGRPDHAGTTPMDMRKDAMEAASRLVISVTDRAKALGNAVTTVGRLSVEPCIVNIVAGKVSLWIDFRSTEKDKILAMRKGIDSDLEGLKKTMGIDSVLTERMIDWPVAMDEGLRARLRKSCGAIGVSHMDLPSGAGHDAQIFAEIAPAAMMFVPSIGGRSHCPEEKTDEVYMAMAVQAVCDTVMGINEDRCL
ncbi:MAG: M20 family metallo-hydrolase [Firmicutes bacterium]|nr:M20 family metallo-hydrolase [Bacillota bacterium]